MRLLCAIEKRPVLRFVHAAPTMKIGDGDARIHCVDAHAVRCHLERRAPRQMIQRRFADAVGQHAGKRSQAVDAGHVHHMPAPPFSHRGQQSQHQSDRAEIVDADRAVEVMTPVVLVVQ